MDFTIQILDSNGTPLHPNNNATPGAALNYESSYKNQLGCNSGAWTLPLNAQKPWMDGQEFYYAEAYNFITDKGTRLIPSDISGKGKITVTTKPNIIIPKQMWLSCGDQSVCMQPDQNNKGTWYWFFSDNCSINNGNLSRAFNNLSSDPNVLQMTLQPYDRDRNNQTGQGYRSAVICLGIQNYTLKEKRIDLKASAVQTWVSKYQGMLNPEKDTWIGGLAGYLLWNTDWDLSSHFHLEIDTEISIGGCLSCAIATGITDNDVQIGALSLHGAWSVYGTHRVNGFQNGYSLPASVVGAERQIKCGLLDISTSYIPVNDGFAIDLAGPTFAYPGTRYKGAVQLNTFDMYDAGNTGESFKTRLNKFVNNFKSGNVFRDKFGPVKVFDTKMIGGWCGASDGIETMGPGSYFDRNFIHTADDSIKLRAPDVKYNNTTIWQGDTGAAINPTAYGYVNGGVGGCEATGVFIHRVTHRLAYYGRCNDPLMQNDDLGGLVSNRTGFSDDWFTPDGNNDLVFTNVNITDVYVPSLVNNYGKDVNSIGRLCVISAINPASGNSLAPNVPCKATRTTFLPRPTDAKYSLNIDLSHSTWDFSKVNFATSYSKTDQYSRGAIVTGDFNFFAANLPPLGWNWIPYELKNNKEVPILCQVLPPAIKP